MKIAERIQNLRKVKGISQEELADKIGVSRQTISKWESEQSTPDIDKVVLMSDYFGVTTDYLLKGIEEADHKDGKLDAKIFSIVGLLICGAGLFASISVWIEYQTAVAVAFALVTDLAGIAIFMIGQYIGVNREKAKMIFWLIGIWPITFAPYSCLFNFLQGLIFSYSLTFKPFPEIVGNSIVVGVIGWILYFGICILFDYVYFSNMTKNDTDPGR